MVLQAGSQALWQLRSTLERRNSVTDQFLRLVSVCGRYSCIAVVAYWVARRPFSSSASVFRIAKVKVGEG